MLPALLLLSACASPPTPHPEHANLVVLSWNVNFGMAGDPAAIEILAGSGADVVLLQETNGAWWDALGTLQATFPFQQQHDPGGAGGFTILSRYPIEAHAIDDSGVGWFEAQRATITTPHGPVQFVNVHLQPPVGGPRAYFDSKSVRGQEMDWYLRVLDPDAPTVVAGDFNEAGGRAITAIEDWGFTSALGTYDPDSVTWHWGTRLLEVTATLDHLYVDGALAARDAKVLAVGNSDHYPIVAWLEVGAVATPKPQKRRRPTSGYGLGS